MSIGVIVDFHVKPEAAESVIATFRDRLPSTRGWDGCEDIYLGVRQDDPSHLYLVEKWSTREQYDRYREWAMAQPGTQEMLEVMDGELVTTYVDDAGA